MKSLTVYDYIAFGIAAVLLALVWLYTFLRNRKGEKALWLKAVCSILFLAVAGLMYFQLDDYLALDKLLFAAGVLVCFIADLVIGVNNVRIKSGMLVFGAAHILFCISMVMNLELAGTASLYIFLSVVIFLFVCVLLAVKFLNVDLGRATLPAYFYAACLSASAALAFASLPLDSSLIFLLPIGFGLFYVSDAILAFTHFKKQVRILNYVSLYAYYGAMLVLAFSIAFII